jgi:hypothetical protein
VLDIQVRGANKLRAMADQLRKADKEYLGRQLTRAIKRAAEPTLKDLRESARNIHTTGVRKPGARRPFTAVMPPKGIRAKVADSITANVTISENPRVQFKTGRGLPAELKNMPRNFDVGEFRHPIMGNRDAWVSQRSDPWFFEPIRRNLKTFRAEIDVALDATREMLERG